MPNDVQVAYAAGIVDGEGSIYMTVTRARGTQVVVRVNNTDLRLVEWLYREFGGSVQGMRAGTPRRKPCWAWNAYADNAERFLRAVRPHLLLKGAQADLALAALALRGRPHVRLTPEAREARERIRTQLRILNRRGVEA